MDHCAATSRIDLRSLVSIRELLHQNFKLIEQVQEHIHFTFAPKPTNVFSLVAATSFLASSDQNTLRLSAMFGPKVLAADLAALSKILKAPLYGLPFLAGDIPGPIALLRSFFDAEQ